MRTRHIGSPASQERSVPLVLVLAIAAVVAAFGYTAAPRAAASDGGYDSRPPAAHSPTTPQRDEAMGWNVPPGRPQVECSLPAGHPPVHGDRALPPGHPAGGDRATGLPQGHPPVHERPAPAVAIERVDPSIWI